MNLKNKRLKILLSIIIYFIIFLLLNNAQITPKIKPFGGAFLFALIYLSANPAVLLPTYFLSYFALNASLNGFIIALNTVSTALLCFALFKFIKKPMKFYHIILFFLLGQSAYVLFNVGNLTQTISVVITIAVGILFIYIFKIILSAMFTRGIQSKMTLDETICLSLFIIVLSMGMNNLNIANFSIKNIVVLLLLFFTSSVMDMRYTLFLATMLGIGSCFLFRSVAQLSIMLVWAVAILAFAKKNRLLSVLFLLVCDISFGMYFNVYKVYSAMHFVEIAVASGIFLVIPKKTILYLQDFFGINASVIANSYLIEKDKVFLKKKLKNVSNIFFAMHETYKKTLIGKLKNTEVVDVLADDVVLKKCAVCDRYKICHSCSNTAIKMGISNMVEIGLSKDRLTLVDMPQNLSSCTKISTIISAINQNIVEYRQYQGLIDREDQNKLFVSTQMLGAGRLINNISSKLIIGERANYEKEKFLMEELLNNNIISRECLIYETQRVFKKAILIIKKDSNLEKTLDVLDNFFRLKVEITDQKYTDFAGWKILVVEPAPMFNIVVGVASTSKENLSNGDKYTYLNLGDNKCLIGISDGKGAGKSAENTSENAISLIEDFYRAGFDSDIAIYSANQLLCNKNAENFSAIDLCVIDNNSGRIDFVKVGACPTVIKHQNTIETVTSESLPLGIIDGAKPAILKKFLAVGDIVVLVSDGVFDAFDDIDEYIGYLNNERLINMNFFAESLLEEATKRRHYEKLDDMTVVAFRVLKNV